MKYTDKEKQLFIRKVKKLLLEHNRHLVTTQSPDFNTLYYKGNDLLFFSDHDMSIDRKESYKVPHRSVTFDRFYFLDKLKKIFNDNITMEDVSKFFDQQKKQYHYDFSQQKLHSGKYIIVFSVHNFLRDLLDNGYIKESFVRKKTNLGKTANHIMIEDLKTKFKNIFNNYPINNIQIQFSLWQHTLVVMNKTWDANGYIHKVSEKSLKKYFDGISDYIESNGGVLKNYIEYDPNALGRYDLNLEHDKYNEQFDDFFSLYKVEMSKHLLTNDLKEIKNRNKIKI